MNNMPDYSVYHLDELKMALSKIDESENPEEARVIREFIEKGGYIYPTNPPIEKVIFSNPIYKWLLALILSILLIFNVYVLLMWNAVTPLLPIAIQSTLLYMIFKGHKNTRAAIKIWCVLLLIGACFGFISIYYAPVIVISKLIEYLFLLVVGLSFLVFADKSVKLVPRGSNKKL